MAKRHLSQRQKQRIQKLQERRRQRLTDRVETVLAEADNQSVRAGRVIARHGANLAVEDETGGIYHCLSRQNLGQLVCGDRVVWQPIDAHNGVVTALQERSTVLTRPDYSGRERPLAANITQLVIILAPEPEPSRYLIDQYLVAAELIGLKTSIIVNKIDLLDNQQAGNFTARFSIYGQIGYSVLCTSTRYAESLAPLSEQLHGETSILVGQSGVGKSSLVKALLPDLKIQIGRLSEATGLGRHTTSATTCYRLPEGGDLIDSPGVRSFRLGPIKFEQLQQGFVEFRPLLGHCRFSNCRHRQEPGCALQAAVTEGRIDAERLENFMHMAK